MPRLFPDEPTSEVVARVSRHLTPNYRPAPLVLERGEGVRVFDRDGKAYLDMVGGIAVNCLGHAHPRLTRVIAEQAAQLMHVSNLFINEPSLALAEELVTSSGLERVFFTNSGTEANEAALKTARRYQTVVANKPQRTGVLAFYDSFHGRSYGALSVTGQPKYHAGFEPLVPGARFARFGDLAEVDRQLEEAAGTVGAIIIEPIQCEGGINMPPPGFLEGLRERANDQDIVLIFDEVQTGVGRTGRWWCFEHYDTRPDILTTAKGIAGGVPLGAMMAKGSVAEALQPGTHASTFGANPLATRAGLEVVRVIREDGLLERASRLGERLQDGLKRFIGEFFGLATEVRGRGLLQGLEVASPELAKRTVEIARDKGLLLNAVQGKTLRFVPPLVTTEADIDEALALTRASLAAS